MKIIQSPGKGKKKEAISDNFSAESSSKKQSLSAKAKSSKKLHETGADLANLDSEKQVGACSANSGYKKSQQEVNQCELPPGKKRRRSELNVHNTLDANQVPLIEIDPAKKEFNEVFERGVRLLSMREHSVKEMHEKLRAKTDNDQHVLEVIDSLLDKGYLSDERFAEAYVRVRANRGFGPIKIRSELKNKGVNSILMLEYLNENSTQWFDNAALQYQKKYGDGVVEDYQTWVKRARFLQGRGFTSDQIQCVVPQVNRN